MPGWPVATVTTRIGVPCLIKRRRDTSLHPLITAMPWAFRSVRKDTVEWPVMALPCGVGLPKGDADTSPDGRPWSFSLGRRWTGPERSDAGTGRIGWPPCGRIRSSLCWSEHRSKCCRSRVVSFVWSYWRSTGGGCWMALETAPTHASTVAATARRLFLIWQDPETRQLIKVGQLEELVDGHYVFTYLPGARHDGFSPLVQYPEIDGWYPSTTLPAFFVNRVMSRSRPSYGEFRHWIGLDNEGSDTPFE